MVKAPVANLVRYKPSGIYFDRAKVGGKLIRQSLKTRVLSNAKLKLRDLLAGEERKLQGQKAIVVGKPVRDSPRFGKVMAGTKAAGY